MSFNVYDLYNKFTKNISCVNTDKILASKFYFPLYSFQLFRIFAVRF